MSPSGDATDAVPGAFHALPFAVGAQYDFQWPFLLWAAGIFGKAEGRRAAACRSTFTRPCMGQPSCAWCSELYAKPRASTAAQLGQEVLGVLLSQREGCLRTSQARSTAEVYHFVHSSFSQCSFLPVIKSCVRNHSCLVHFFRVY